MVMMVKKMRINKYFDLLEAYNIILRDSRRRLYLSPISYDFLDTVHAYKVC